MKYLIKICKQILGNEHHALVYFFWCHHVFVKIKQYFVVNLVNSAFLFFRHFFQSNTTDKVAIFIPCERQIATSNKDRIPCVFHSLKMFSYRITSYGIIKAVMGNSQKCFQRKRQFNSYFFFQFLDFPIRNHSRNQLPFLPFIIRVHIIAPHFFFLFLKRKCHTDFFLWKLLIILFKKISHVFLILGIGHFSTILFIPICRFVHNHIIPYRP